MGKMVPTTGRKTDWRKERGRERDGGETMEFDRKRTMGRGKGRVSRNNRSEERRSSGGILAFMKDTWPAAETR